LCSETIISGYNKYVFLFFFCLLKYKIHYSRYYLILMCYL